MALALGLWLLPPRTAQAVETFTDPGFFSELVTTLPMFTPVGFAWAPDGRMFIWQKNGVVRIFKNGVLLPTPFLDFSAKVNTFVDRGFLGLALHPNFALNRHVYLLYTFEERGNPGDIGPKTARLSRVTADPANPDVMLPGSEVVILGTISVPPCTNYPEGSDCMAAHAYSHTIGTVRFAPDGTLFVGNGDGASPEFADPEAFRAQRLTNYSGKILRIKEDGSAPGDNPFDDGTNSIRSKVWAYGLRNPFRFALHPVTGEPYIGDVGWNDWEEVNRGRGRNFGWPCYEGLGPQPIYQAQISQCSQVPASTVTPPLYTYNHSVGATILAGAFYTGTAYPAAYQGTLFIADYTAQWIRRMVFDADGNLLSVQPFASGVSGPVSVELGPDGLVYYAALDTGQIRRIRFNGPLARVSATPTSGYSPLSVSFSSVGSMDTGGLSIDYLWEFGDGATSTQANPQHTYVATGVRAFPVSLTVTNSRGQSSADTMLVTVGSLPPIAIIMAPIDGTRVAPGDPVFFQGLANDPDQGALPAAALAWEILLHHNDHVHVLGTTSGSGGSFVVSNHGEGVYAYEIVLTATDASGLSGVAGVLLPVGQSQTDTIAPSQPTRPSATGMISTTQSSSVSATTQASSSRTYTTSFPLTENPISEGGNWVNGGTTGPNWTNVRTTPGKAFGTQPGNSIPPYNDSVALLTGSWGPDQTVEATVFSQNPSSSVFQEVELRLRSTFGPNSLTGYEINFRPYTGAGTWTQIWRWNGPPPIQGSDVTQLAGVERGVVNGDVVKATIVGNVIKVFINDVQVLQATDSTYTSGNPGMGFYLQNVTGINSDYGFTRFTATDGSLPPPPPPDTIPPTVEITSPTASSTVSGTISILASASDDTGVVGVQFQLDSINLGPEATTPPHSMVWDTRTASNGPHVLTAVARDASRNRGTSTEVMIVVDNPPPPPGPPPLPAGLVAGWAFDEGTGTVTADASGFGHTGTVSNGATWTAGRVGSALSFDGVDDYVEVAGPSTLNLGTADFTITAWIKRNALGSVQRHIFSKCASATWTTGCKEFYFGPNNQLRFGSFAAGDFGQSGTIADTAWHHVAVTFVDSSNTMRLYIDGVLNNTGTVALEADGAGHVVRIGRLTNDYFSGLIDEVHIYNRSLAQTEIQQDMHAIDTTPPSQPTGLAATAVTQTQVSLAWNASTDNVGVTGYRVLRNGTVVGTPGATSFADSGLSPQTSYTYTVSALDAAGNASMPSAPLTVTTTAPPPPDTQKPTPPTGLTATAVAQAQVTLSWTASTDNVGVTGYRVLRNGTVVGTPTTTSYTDIGLTPQTPYTYAIVAVDAAGNASDPSSPLTVTTTAPPPPDTQKPTPPTGLTATAVAQTQVTLSWTASTDNVSVTGYRLLRGGTVVGTPATTSHTDTGLTPQTPYTYTVVALDAAGNVSDPSAPLTVTTTAAPPLPVGLVAAWAFDDGIGTVAADASGLGHTGTLFNGPIWTTGRVGSALSFDGINDYVQVAGPSALNLGTADFTITAWIKRNALGSVQRHIFSKCASTTWTTGCKEFYFGPNNQLRFGSFAAGDFGQAGTIADTAWHHVAVTFVDSSNTMRLYVDGVPNNTGTVTLEADGTSHVVRIGRMTNNFFSGLIDEVRVYNRALSQTEIQQDRTAPLNP